MSKATEYFIEARKRDWVDIIGGFLMLLPAAAYVLILFYVRAMTIPLNASVEGMITGIFVGLVLFFITSMGWRALMSGLMTEVVKLPVKQEQVKRR